MSYADEDVSLLVGKTLTRAEKTADDCIEFDANDGNKYKLYHYQDCCETVRINDICGDLEDLVGAPIIRAEKRESEQREGPAPEYADSWTWTFYEFATIKGSVTMRWLGESNGYYSEAVDFAHLNKAK